MEANIENLSKKKNVIHSKNKLLFIIIVIIISVFFFDFIFRKSYKKIENIVKNKGSNEKIENYKKNIYLLTMSVTLTTIIVVMFMIIYRRINDIDIPPTLYTTFFILIAIFFGHIAQLLGVLKNTLNEYK